MGKFLGIAWRSLVEHRRRNLMLGVAIAAVTALLVLLTALSGGMRDTMLRAATTLSSGHVNVAGFYKITSGNPAPIVTEYAKIEALVRQETPGLDYVIDRTRGWAKLVGPDGSVQAGIGGVDITREEGLRSVLRLAAEKEYEEGGADVVRGDLDELSEPNTILLFAEQARRLGADVGDQVTLSAPTIQGTNNTADVRVVAIARDIGILSNWSVFVPHQVLRDVYKLADSATGALHLYLKDPSQIEAVKTHLRGVLAEAGYTLMEPEDKAFWMKFERVQREDWTGQKIDVTDWEDEVSFMSWTITTVDTLTALLVGILLVLIMVGITNTLWIAIRERTREIGTLRAIGMQRRHVLVMFLSEALLLGVIAAGIGAAAGAGIALGVDAAELPVASPAFRIFTLSETLSLRIAPAAVVEAVAFIAAMTMLAALYPAWRAARLKPISAIHQVG